jgi:hypothetical protein
MVVLATTVITACSCPVNSGISGQMFEIKMRVHNRSKTEEVNLHLNVLFLVCIKTVTNDTVKGIAFCDCRKEDKGAFLRSIGFKVPRSGI